MKVRIAKKNKNKRKAKFTYFDSLLCADVMIEKEIINDYSKNEHFFSFFYAFLYCYYGYKTFNTHCSFIAHARKATATLTKIFYLLLTL